VLGTRRGPSGTPRLEHLAARAFPLSIHQVFFRLAVAGVFLRAGLQKARGWETTVALFSDEYKLPGFPPEIAAVMATCFELGCSTLLSLDWPVGWPPFPSSA
jgi:uncharacterized membrane protein YphA (DoxX/SURF4 family)